MVNFSSPVRRITFEPTGSDVSGGVEGSPGSRTDGSQRTINELCP
jgi:hypothetical protein